MSFYWTKKLASSSWRVQLKRKWVLTPAGAKANVPDTKEDAYQPIRSFVDKIKTENNAVTLTIDVNIMEEAEKKQIKATVRLYDNSELNIMQVIEGSLDDNPSVCKYSSFVRIFVKFVCPNRPNVIFDDFHLPKNVPLEKWSFWRP